MVIVRKNVYDEKWEKKWPELIVEVNEKGRKEEDIFNLKLHLKFRKIMQIPHRNVIYVPMTQLG